MYYKNHIAGCDTEVGKLRSRGQYKEAKSGYIPKPGDIIFFKNASNWYYHTGIVKSCDGTTVYTIEGNSGGSSTTPYWMGSKVAENNYSLTYTDIGGYFSINGE